MQGIHIYGNNPNYGMYMKVCTWREDPDCEGGNKESDTVRCFAPHPFHFLVDLLNDVGVIQWFYYTRAGTCGGADYSNWQQVRYESSMSAEYASATGNATSTNVTVTATATSTSTMLSSDNSTAVLLTVNSTVATVPSTSVTSLSLTETSSDAVQTSISASGENPAANALRASSAAAAPSALQGGAASLYSLSTTSVVIAALGVLLAMQ